MKEHASAPWQIRMAGALAIAVGTTAIVEMAFGLFLGHAKLDFGFLGLPIGFGLLAGHREALTWGRIGSGFHAIVMLVLLLVSFLSVEHFPTLTAADVLGLIDVTVWMLLVNGFVFAILLQRRSSDWFRTTPVDRADALAWGIPTMCVAALLGMSAEVSRVQTEHALDNVFPVDFEIVAIDHDSGEVIRGVSVGGFHAPEKTTASPPLHKLSIQGSASGSLIYRGVAQEPFTIQVSAEGFEPAVVSINEATPEQLRVLLKRSATSTAPQTDVSSATP